MLIFIKMCVVLLQVGMVDEVVAVETGVSEDVNEVLNIR